MLAQGAQDTASTAYATLQRAHSSSALTCDSSCCTLCQPNLPEALLAYYDPFLHVLAQNSPATVGTEQPPVENTATGAAVGQLPAAWPCTRTSSPSSSQSAQDVMFLEEQGEQNAVEEVTEADFQEASRIQGSAVGSTPSSLGQFVDGGDDFVQVERADLQHGYASSTNLALQHVRGSTSGGPRKRQCAFAPLAAGTLPGDSSGSEAERMGSCSVADRCALRLWCMVHAWRSHAPPQLAPDAWESNKWCMAQYQRWVCTYHMRADM